MLCVQCKADIPDDALFCNQCGARQSRTERSSTSSYSTPASPSSTELSSSIYTASSQEPIAQESIPSTPRPDSSMFSDASVGASSALPLSMLTSQQKPNKNSQMIIVAVVLLVAIVVVVCFVAFRGRGSTLAVQYVGSINNDRTLTLTNILQNQNEISGDVIVDTGSPGTLSCLNGHFKGVIQNDGELSFTVTGSPCTSNGYSRFVGSVQADGSLSGTYTGSFDKFGNENGTWQATPAHS